MATMKVYEGQDRRTDSDLRTIFDQAYLMIEPFFNPASGWVGRSLEHLAFRVLRENFAGLTAGQAHVIIVAAHRVYIERNPEQSAHLKRPEDFR